MPKKLLVALAILAPLFAASLVDRTRLAAQSTTSLVISEFRTRGPLGGNDEFVEVFNPTAAAVDISGWKIRGSNASGTIGDRATFPAGTTLGPQCYFLVTNATASTGYSGSVAGNLTYTTGITDDGGLALTRGDNSIVDQAGMSAGSAFGEGTRLASFGATNGDRAYARTPTSGSDTGDNATDFVMTTPSGPQNLASVAGCAGGPIDQGDAVISQIYGGGGNSGATFTNDFIELFNPGPDPVNLAGWSVQYASAAGTSWQVTPLSGTIAPGRYHLVQEAGSGTATPLPAPDSTGAINLSATAGKIALVRSLTPFAVACPASTEFVDLVGYGSTATCFEGSAPASGLGNDVSAVRAGGGCSDTDDNAADFGTVSPPTPRNSASPLNDCHPPVILWPHDVQSALNASPLVGQLVAVRGIVTAKRFNNGFFIQTPDATAALEGDPATSEGLFVFTSVAPSAVNVGDDVIVTGTVAEFSPAADPRQPPVTEIVAPTVAVQSTGQPLPAPIALTAADLSPTGGPLQLEKYEGMRVAPGLLTVVAPTSGTVNEVNATGSNNGVFYTVFLGSPRPFREAGIDVIDSPPPCDELASSACAIPIFDGNPERLRVDSDGQVGVFPGAIVSTGATITIATGVLDYAFRTWTVLPDLSALTIVTPGAGPQAVPVPTVNDYQIASFNLQRFFDTSNDPENDDDPVLTATAYNNRLAKASLIVRNFLRTPDIIGVQEAENLLVLQDLAARIDADAAAAGQPAPGYQAFLLEGNDIGGIDVGVLARGNVTAHSVEQWRPGETFVDPSDQSVDLLNDRPSLIVDATVQGPANRLPARVFVVVNHLRSLNGVDDAADGPRVRAKRRAQGESVAQLLIDLQSQHPGVPIVSVGDYNAFEVSDGYVDVLGIIRGDQVPAEQVVEWSPLSLDPDFVSAAPAGDYSYSFDGNAQTLDHVLLSSDAVAALSGFGHAHIDADFPEAFRADPARPERLSDHDPAVARFAYPLDTIAPVFGPVSAVVAQATSFDGAAVTYTPPTATDNLDGVVPVQCVPESGSFFAVGSTTVMCTAGDIAGNTATTSFVVTVNLADDTGAMLGVGQINAGTRVTFTFFARQAQTGAERGWLTLAANRPRGLPNTLVAIGLGEVVFLGPAVRFSGVGFWNGQGGHTFVAESADNGEPGVGRDTFSVTVRDPQGAIVLQTGGTLTAGNVDKLQ
jgi:predicted extracellular nuclease